MDLQLKDKVIFVAGASRGIGLGIVEACPAEGAKLAMTARGAEALEETRARLADQYGSDRLWAMAGEKLREDPRSGAVFVFCNKDRDRVKMLYWDGTGVWIFAKRLEKGRFVWPVTREGSVVLTTAQLSMLLEGIDWRLPARTWQLVAAG